MEKQEEMSENHDNRAFMIASVRDYYDGTKLNGLSKCKQCWRQRNPCDDITIKPQGPVFVTSVEIKLIFLSVKAISLS